MRLGENSIEDTSNKESKQRNFDKQNTQSQDNENSLMWAPPPLGVLAASAAAIRKSVVPPIAAEFDRIQHDIDDIIFNNIRTCSCRNETRQKTQKRP